MPELVASAPGTPFGIAADASGVYWATASPGADGGSILKLAPGAKEPQLLATGLVTPFDVTLDAKNVYFTELGALATGGAVKSVPKTGGATSGLVAGAPKPTGVAVDAKNLYWIAGDGTIMKADLAGAGATKLAADQKRPDAIAVDETSVYWTDEEAGAVVKVAKVGGTPVLLATKQPRPRGLGLSSTHVYWTTSGTPASADGESDGAPGEVRRVQLDGTGVQTLAAGQGIGGFGSLALDGSAAYWLDVKGSDYDVTKVALPAGSPEVLATGSPGDVDGGGPAISVFDLATDDASVYWTAFDGIQGSVFRISK